MVHLLPAMQGWNFGNTLRTLSLAKRKINMPCDQHVVLSRTATTTPQPVRIADEVDMGIMDTALGQDEAIDISSGEDVS